MLLLKHGVVYVLIMVLSEIKDTEQVDSSSTSQAHAPLFFSTLLKDKLGVYQDQNQAILACNGGVRNTGTTTGQITYRWYKSTTWNGNFREIISDPRYTLATYGDLIIKSSDFTKDEGYYQCRITDSSPEKWSLLSNIAELRLAYANGPVNKQDVAVTGEEGKPWKYIFTGYQHSMYPKPKYNWQFKGQSLQETNRISVSEDGNLYIAELSLNDIGKYSFQVEVKGIRQRRESVNLAVSKRTSTSDILAVFMLGPKSKTVSLKSDNEVTFECFPSGSPMPQIQWKKDGRVLRNGDKYQIKDFNKRLTVKQLNVADSGRYECTITRAAVNSVSGADLTVIDPPVVTSIQPQDQIGHIGNYSLLTCKVTGSFNNVGYSFKWFRNGLELSRSSRMVMTSHTLRDYREYTLNISRLQKNPDGGMYQCFAKNNGGEGMAYTAIDVQTLLPKIIFGPGRPVYAVLGRPVWINCTAIGSPPITFTWEKNGRPFDPPSPPGNGRDGKLYIKSVGQSDAARYECIASNGPRTIDKHRSSGWLEIVSALVVVNQSSTVYVPKGSHPNIYSGLRYDPKVNITFKWYFKDNLITNGRLEVKSDGRLVINGAYERDDGIYRCEATSVYGHYSTTVEVIVQAPPYRTSAPQIEEIRPDSVRLKWKPGYDGNSAIRYYTIGIRYANGTESIYTDRIVPSGDIQKYVVPGLTPSSKYQFRIRAVNSVGRSPWSHYSKEVQTVEAAPSYSLKKVSGSSISERSIEVKWEYPPKSTHNGVLLGYYVGWRYAGVSSGYTTRRVTPATKTRFIIDHLILNSPYEVVVQMFNRAGAGPYSVPIVVRTKEGLPSGAPRNLSVRAVSSRSIVLAWEAPRDLDWNGEKKSYIVRFREFDKEKPEWEKSHNHDHSAFIQVFNVTHLKTYTQYVFTVKAHNNIGGGPPSSPVQAKTTEDVPTAPRSLSIVEQYSDTISVSWLRPREVNGVLTGYIVRYWPVGYWNKRKVQHEKGDALQAGITSLSFNTRYMIEVAAKTKAGNSTGVRIQGRTLDKPVAPTAPSNLRFLEINATTMELDWDEGSKGRSPIIKYIIEGNNETGFANDHTSKWFDALILKDPFRIFNVPPVIIRHLHPFTIYRFRVTAVNKVGSSYWSDVSPERRTAEDPPSSPPLNVGVKPSKLNPGELLLSWQIPSKETWNSISITYSLVLEEVGDGGNLRNTSGIGGHVASYKLSALKKFTTYRIYVKTVNRIGSSPYSPPIIGRTQEHVPGLPPDKIRAIGASGSSIRITWSPVPMEQRNGNIRGYKLFYRLFEYAVQNFKEIDVGNVTSYLLKKLKGYTQYDIRLLAYTKIGDGKRSDALRPFPRTLETKPGPPSRLHFPTIDSSIVVVKWDVPELTGGNITMYQVKYKPRDDASAPFVTRPTVDFTKRSETVTRLGTDKYYVFHVLAHTSVGWGTPAIGQVYTSREGNKGKPEVPLILPIPDSAITSRSITIRWAVVTRRRHPIRFFRLQLKKVQGAWQTHPKPLKGEARKMVVWGLDPGHSYTFRISAVIDAGESDYSIPSPPVKTLNKSPFGSPRQVRITSSSPTTLTVEWQPPSLVDIQASVRRYRLGYRRHSSVRREDLSTYFDVQLPASTRKHRINNLQEFTLYDISLNAVDETNQDLTSYLETRRTSAPIPPPPSLKTPGNVGPTSVTIYWDQPSARNTPILGYKAVYRDQSKRRRRRAVNDDPSCEKPEPGQAYFSNTSSKGTITNLKMYTAYSISLYSYNSAGDSPGSIPVSVTTKEGVPGPPAKFDFDGVYGQEVHLYWKPPCEPNGRLTQYKLTVSADARGKIQETTFDSDIEEYKVKGLALLTNYKFELVAFTSQGQGVPKILKTRTAGAPVKPNPPTNIEASAKNNRVTLTWRNGHHGNTPITKYIVESRRSSERSPWAVQKTFKASEVNRNREQGTMWVVLEDLDPNTVYWFRIFVENEVDQSSTSDPSDSVLTGDPVPTAREAPIYEKIWFISVMAVIGLIILILLVVCIICICRRRRTGGKRLTHGVELNLQPRGGAQPYSSYEDSLTNGRVKAAEEEKLPFNESEEEEEEEEEQASSLETKSDLSGSGSEDDIPSKKREMEEALREQDKYSKPLRSFSSDNVHNSPPPAYATFAGRGNARSEPFLEPFNEFDDEPESRRGYKLPFDRPPTRRGASQYDDDSSDGSEIQRRKRGDPRTSSFRRALISGNPEPEPERPIGDEHKPKRKPKPMPRKYRSLEQAVNESAKPPSYDDEDEDDRIRQPGLSRFTSPPEYRSDSGRDSSDEHDRVPLSKSSGPFSHSERSESPAPAYQSSTEDSSEYPDRHRLLDGNQNAEPEISDYSSFV